MLSVLAAIGYLILALILLLCWIIIVPRSIYIEYTRQNDITVKIGVLFFKVRLYPNLFTKKDKTGGEAEPQEGELPPQSDHKANEQVDTKQTKPPENGQGTPQAATAEPIEEQKAKADTQQHSHGTAHNTKTKGEPEDKQGKAKSHKKDYLKDLPQGFELVKEGITAVKGVFKILLRGIKIKDVCFTLPLREQDAYETQQLYGKVTSAFYLFNTFLQRYVRIYYKNPIFIADFANLYKESIYFYCKIQASPSIMIVVGWHLFKTYRKLIKNSTNKTDKTDKEK